MPAVTLMSLRTAKLLAALALASSLAGCAFLPRSGPLASEIRMTQPGEDSALEGLVTPLTAAVAAQLAAPPKPRPQADFLGTPPLDPERLAPLDVVDVTIWEASGSSVFGGAAGGATRLENLRIEPDGTIHIPYAGKVRAAGSTPGELRARIAAALAPMTLDPQVDVRLTVARSRFVTIQGSVGRPGFYPLEAGALSITPLLAVAGGSTAPAEQLEVKIRRGETEAAVMLSDIYDDPALDLALRSGDVIIVSPLRERFVVLGATSIQAEIVFPTRPLNLLSALGLARGLRDFDADPSGVFVFRTERRAVADALLPGPPPDALALGDSRPIVFQLDMTAPGALFAARSFTMRDGDAIFATNAPLTEFRKVVQLFSTAVSPVQTSVGIVE